MKKLKEKVKFMFAKNATKTEKSIQVELNHKNFVENGNIIIPKYIIIRNHDLENLPTCKNINVGYNSEIVWLDELQKCDDIVMDCNSNILFLDNLKECNDILMQEGSEITHMGNLKKCKDIIMDDNSKIIHIDKLDVAENIFVSKNAYISWPDVIGKHIGEKDFTEEDMSIYIKIAQKHNFNTRLKHKYVIIENAKDWSDIDNTKNMITFPDGTRLIAPNDHRNKFCKEDLNLFIKKVEETIGEKESLNIIKSYINPQITVDNNDNNIERNTEKIIEKC